ncbi:MAG: nucleotidyltransferase family protein, partial [Ruminococcaceae bacterium]|nr:nucleotidyltransferase family protein [Oscillospiraceae bacterium]
MNIAGIICEYNPFHNGHKYQIEMLKKSYDAVVCIMSGSFVQRGDVAIFNKWTRAKACLMSGCDLVIELPVIYSLSSAQGFSRGAVSILDKTNVIDVLSFGSESGNMGGLREAALILKNEPECVSTKIKDLLKQGLSYPAAREMAY